MRWGECGGLSVRYCRLSVRWGECGGVSVRWGEYTSGKVDDVEDVPGCIQTF